MTISSAPDQGALSTDDAIAALDSFDPADEGQDTEEQPAAPEPAAADEPDDGTDAGDAPEENTDEGDDPDTPASDEEEEPGQEEPAQPAIDPPASWDADAKADFAQLPRTLQEKIQQREQQREQATNTALERAKRAESSVQQHVELDRAQFVAQYKPVLDQLVANAQATFNNRWNEVDWATLRATDPVQYLVAKDAYEAEQQQLQQAQTAQQVAAQAADTAQHREFLRAQQEKLPQLVPDLADPVHGAARGQALAAFLQQRGVSDLKWAAAEHLAIAYDAFRYREFLAAQERANAAPLPAPKPSPVTPSQPLRPRSAPSSGNSRTRALETARSRLAQSGSVDDAVALLELRGT